MFEIVSTLAERLAEGGDVVGLAYGIRPETPPGLRDRIAPGVELFPMPWLRRTPAAQVRSLRALRRLARDWEPDVVHLHSSFAGVAGALALARSDPTVYTPHGYSFTMGDQDPVRLRAYRAVERRVARRVDVIGAVSATEGALARAELLAPRVVVVRNGIPELDEGRLAAPARPPEPQVIAMGRADAARRPESAARILHAVSDLARVAWVGGAGRRSAGELELAALGVEVSGWLPRSEALERLSGSTAYLHWAAWDGQPLAVLEAMARDVVVVGSDIPPLREILGAEQVCASEEQAIELLRAVLGDDALRERLLASQRERRAVYGTGRMVAEWRGLYRQLAAGRGGGQMSELAASRLQEEPYRST